MKGIQEDNLIQPPAYPWVTAADLAQFKVELIQEIQALLTSANCQHSPKRWLKTYEVRKLLNVSAGTLQTLRANGTLPYTKMGGALYYEYQDIENLLEKEKVVKRWHGQK